MKSLCLYKQGLSSRSQSSSPSYEESMAQGRAPSVEENRCICEEESHQTLLGNKSPTQVQRVNPGSFKWHSALAWSREKTQTYYTLCRTLRR